MAILGSACVWPLARPAQAASFPAAEARNGMVVSSQALAARVGVDILKQGGNAVDAAVAVGYAEAVVNPCCGNIGGGGFMTLHLADGRDRFINFREMAPARARPDMYQDAQGELIPNASLLGYGAVGVPGTVLGLDTAHQQYGRLTRSQVMAPAIALARDGFVLTRADTDLLDLGVKYFRKDAEAARIFLRPDGSALQPGDRLVQADLARTLQAIAEQGPDAFYQGRIPAAVEAAARAGGGVISAADFAAYRVTETQPLRCTYRGFVFLSAPPPSSGGTTLCEILNVLSGYDLRAMGFGSAQSVHVMAEAMRHAYVDRNTLLGDPAFVDNPLADLLSPAHAARIRARIESDRATPSGEVQPGQGAVQDFVPNEKPETTHYSVIDKDGNAVSTTYTINGRFGATVIAPGTGFFLNDEMDDFTTKVGARNMYGLVQGERNAIAPGKRPLSSMAPTVVTWQGKTYMVLGSPGGSRIITIILETALNIIDHGMAPQQAVDAPRVHHQWLPDELYYEAYGLSPDTLALLRGMGYKLVEQTPWGATALILVGLPGLSRAPAASSGNDAAVSGTVREGYLYGANDARRPAGAAMGY
ncbi:MULTISPECIES: gamma-glutamyltransferase [unclassified Achromobacter]|uniref:gamma-glutamyltransferase n=1 Tax=unclassified Achromobacter TaxID=2626865 RepID=UPI000B519251|nr:MULTISPECIES: gamma-glutamyltransferase [unclassified Achromobacter]OWT81109.1 gamma-glutamyltransferase [Achromobacter sp. HZ34]OWT82610.1 gamma-glutamyltransferase [Achromobacter sp. HZ28]